MNQKRMDNLLVRVDERVKEIRDNVKEHNKKIDRLIEDTVELQTHMENHVNLHKRDLLLLGTGLTVLTIVVNILLHLMG